jgi:methylphosphotriester-DNA--protein-cysteine methyltransferase
LTRFDPPPRLRNRIASIEIVEADGGDTIVLPSTSAVLGIQFRGRVRAGDTLLARAGVTGIQSTARTYSYERGTGSLLVRFTPEGAACLGVPVVELANRSVALDEFLPRAQVAEVHERLGDANDASARVAVLESFLDELRYRSDPLVTRALSLLDTGAESVNVSAAACALGLSERQFERRFLAQVGVTPKRFAMLRRFERVAEQAKTAPSLTAAALEAGYYDQSHFIRDFRRFAGAAPREFFGPPGHGPSVDVARGFRRPAS